MRIYGKINNMRRSLPVIFSSNEEEDYLAAVLGSENGLQRIVGYGEWEDVFSLEEEYRMICEALELSSPTTKIGRRRYLPYHPVF